MILPSVVDYLARHAHNGTRDPTPTSRPAGVFRAVVADKGLGVRLYQAAGFSAASEPSQHHGQSLSQWRRARGARDIEIGEPAGHCSRRFRRQSKGCVKFVVDVILSVAGIPRLTYMRRFQPAL